jgi:putative ABC transport system ATP-binding protein
VRALLAQLNADGQTVLLVTHDLTLAQSCATRTVRLVDGRIASDTSYADSDAGASGTAAGVAPFPTEGAAR